ncbi:MAG: hypothetical protein ACOZIN_01860 [Myxococcota bacterium]
MRPFGCLLQYSPKCAAAALGDTIVATHDADDLEKLAAREMSVQIFEI